MHIITNFNSSYTFNYYLHVSRLFPKYHHAYYNKFHLFFPLTLCGNDVLTQVEVYMYFHTHTHTHEMMSYTSRSVFSHTHTHTHEMMSYESRSIFSHTHTHTPTHFNTSFITFFPGYLTSMWYVYNALS